MNERFNRERAKKKQFTGATIMTPVIHTKWITDPMEKEHRNTIYRCNQNDWIWKQLLASFSKIVTKLKKRNQNAIWFAVKNSKNSENGFFLWSSLQIQMFNFKREKKNVWPLQNTEWTVVSALISNNKSTSACKINNSYAPMQLS